MRIFLPLLSLPSFLAAQGPEALCLKLDLHTPLGSEPATQVRLAPTGCWDGLLLSVAASSARPTPTSRSGQHRMAEATVEVWDVVFQESRFQETFRLFKEDLLRSIKHNWPFAPPTHGQIDAAIRAGNGSGSCSDMAMVQSLQHRFNRLPPNGSPVK